MGICNTCYDEKEFKKEEQTENFKDNQSKKDDESKKANEPKKAEAIIKENKPKQEIKMDKEQYSNYIIAEIDIKADDINKDIRIINSYEEYHRNWDFRQLIENKMNEADIKDCEIRINNKSIPFNYFFQFKTPGKYTIKYIFNNELERTNHLFYKCEYLTKIDCSHFNNDNSTTMEAMFSDCASLTSINFSNFKTKNVTNMNHMFYGCKSLTNLDLSSFDTKKVTNMYSLFEGCKSLINLNLSNFDAEKVDIYEMDYMFDGCDSLKLENIITKDEKIKQMFSQGNILF